ncbi:MAG: prepilin peptidase, partial [bacterium]|nr:prepilin peptidase [bacterium]
MFISLAVVFILGLCVGSFLNVVVDRLVRGERLSGRSYCDFCHQTLNFIDLLPVVSWLIRKGHCRYCHKPLSLQYPLTELATALLFSAGIYFIYPKGIDLTLPGLLTVFYFLYIFSVLLAIFIIDLKYGLVLDVIVLPAIIIAALNNLVPYLWRSVNLFLSLKNDPGLGRYLLKTDYLFNHLLYEGRGVFFNLLGAGCLAILFTLLIKITKGRGLGS